MTAEPILEEVTVTATRRPALADTLSYAVDVVDGPVEDALVTDVLRDTVGVFVQQTTPGQGAPIIRGLKGSSVLHLVDGFRLNNAIFRSAPTQYFALVPAIGVERIEVLRGTPTSLYGSDAIGGAVQLVTRRPRFDERGSRASVAVIADTAEERREWRASVETGDANWAAGVYGQQLDVGDRRIGGGERIEPSGFDASAWRALFAYEPTSDSELTFDVQWSRQPETPRVDELVPGFGQTEPDSAEFFFAPNERRFAQLRYRRSFNDVDWRINIGQQIIDDDRRTRSTGSDVRRFEQNRSRLTGLSTQWSGSAGRTEWVAGIDYYDDRVSSARQEVDITGGGPIEIAPRFPDGSSLLQKAVFANASHLATNALRVSGGLRYNVVDIDLTGPLRPGGLSINDLSGDLGITFDLNDRLQWIANAGFGFRAPNVFDLGTLGERPGNRFNVPNPSLRSEDVVHIDTGLRFRSEKLRAEFVVFALDYSDRIASVETGEITAEGRVVVTGVNAKSSDNYGFEAGLVAQLSDTVQLRGILNYVRGSDELTTTSEPGDRIPPLNGRLTLEVAASERLEWTLSVDFAARQDRLSSRDIADPRINPVGTPGWVSVGAGLTQRFDNDLSVSLSLDNLLDQRFRYHGSGVDATGRNLRLLIEKGWE